MSQDKIVYPTRCQIIDPAGADMGGFSLRAPDESRPQIGKQGVARRIKGGNIKITLDDSATLMGFECWWVPMPEKEEGD